MRIARETVLKEWCEGCVPDANKQYNQIRRTFSVLPEVNRGELKLELTKGFEPPTL
jgi:hypothetical protein